MTLQRVFLLFLLSLFLISGAQAVTFEKWKGKSPPEHVTFGGMAGLAFIDSGFGYAVMGNLAKKVIERGFVEDINDQVFAEVSAGIIGAGGTNAVAYSFHLRWDFHYDDTWTFYALGGLGGFMVSSPPGASSAPFFLRFGVGALLHLSTVVAVRAEASHERVVAGFDFAI